MRRTPKSRPEEEEMALWRWQCSDGCRFLLPVETDHKEQRYRCTFWDSFPMPIAAPHPRPEKFSLDLTPKRMNGPHTSQKTRVCPQYQK